MFQFFQVILVSNLQFGPLAAAVAHGCVYFVDPF
jgi:hypothetical protein